MGPTHREEIFPTPHRCSCDGGLTSSECLLRERIDDDENINRLNFGELPVYETPD
jgi:hypothetical protein